MRFLAVSTVALLASFGAIACDNQAVSPLPDTVGVGGSTGSGSTSSGSSVKMTTAASGGITSTGTSGSGGIPAQGGTSSNTGSVSTGGKSAASGGTSAKGGSSSSATGGSSAKGGTSSAAGGTTAIGGTKAMGGGSSIGGTQATGGAAMGGTKATGGAATGGTKATGGAVATGGTTGGGVTVTKITNGQNGTTTRYWDCCMPSCSWSANASGKSPVKVCGKDGTSFTSESARNACDNGGGGYMCYWGAPWSVSNTVSYGYAAYNGVACGTCFQLDFTGSGINASGLSGKSMIVQAINIGSIGNGQFDLLIPGGGVGEKNACTSNGNQWNGAAVGDQYGGLLKSCNNDCGCVKPKCQSVFGNMPALLAGCNWFTDWLGCADNPGIVFKQVPCPSDITSKSGESG
jgi:hypothetical protein